MKRRNRPSVNVMNVMRRDPTRTATVVRAHISALRRQFANLRGRIVREFSQGGRFYSQLPFPQEEDAAATANTFDPDQPRDEHGRWLSPTHFLMDNAIKSSDNLADHQKVEYSRSLGTVMSKMTPAALSRVGRAVKSSEYHASPRQLTESFAKNSPKAKAILDRGGVIGGAFNPRTGKLTLDGAGVVMPRAGGVTSLSTTGSYAHELGHALDFGGPNDHTISSTPTWKAAWEKELRDGRISNYAGRDEVEGFAEFSRLVHATRLTPDQITSAYPMCAAVWRHHGILA